MTVLQRPPWWPYHFTVFLWPIGLLAVLGIGALARATSPPGPGLGLCPDFLRDQEHTAETPLTSEFAMKGLQRSIGKRLVTCIDQQHSSAILGWHTLHRPPLHA